jgi:DNA-binding NtrC family response regulator
MSNVALYGNEVSPSFAPTRAAGGRDRHLRITPASTDAVVSPAAMDDAWPAFHGMYANSAAMRDLFRVICRVGRTDVTVLVRGESGTGKELVARALHEESARRGKPFVALNCSALPSELVESELFGHTRGAFTGAVKDRGGLFEAAHGGTLFLDEIGDLGPLAQAKVLRALESGEVMRVGGTRSTRVDVRVIAATNRPLEVMVEDGRFREDLLYRLNVIPLMLPPLRERADDIPLLAHHFLQLFSCRHGVPMRTISDEAGALLTHYDWPGNVRELRNVIESAIVLCDGAEIAVCDLPASVANSVGGTSTLEALFASMSLSLAERAVDLPFAEAREQALREFDRAYLGAALARHDGNIARTARALGLHRQSLQKLLARRDMREQLASMSRVGRA